jgi:polyhydroxybutyrate depolymerase
MARYTELDRLAASRGFYLAYLQGRHLSWPPMILPDNPEHIDPDLQFVDALCTELAAKYNVDGKRVYAVGLSQGAAFVNLLVARRSERLAAVRVRRERAREAGSERARDTRDEQPGQPDTPRV